jgi:hypothetical protein
MTEKITASRVLNGSGMAGNAALTGAVLILLP